jgi:glycosyltransferase involved in cell wall biosynthesis
VVPNTIDDSLFELAPPIPGETIRIALVSSNLPKKGLDDFIAVARLLEASVPKARFLLVGPENEHTARMREGALGGPPPGNVEFAGYRKSPSDAIAKADIVVNLSHFQESFGRTILEAMAGGRAVVAYDWGALAELVVDGETGLLVPFRDVPAFAANLEWLCAAPQRILDLGRAGRIRARTEFGRERFAERLRDAYRCIRRGSADSNASTCRPKRADQLFSSL